MELNQAQNQARYHEKYTVNFRLVVTLIMNTTRQVTILKGCFCEISSSIEAVKNASETLLISKLKSRMDKFLFLGTTTVECKSGYGLDTKTELKSLKVIDEVNKKHNIDMIPTFMGAHDFPKKYIELFQIMLL